MISFRCDGSPVRWAGQVALSPSVVRRQVLEDEMVDLQPARKEEKRGDSNPLLAV